MKRLYEQGEDALYSESHAKELLAVQANYNKSLQELNNKLAKQKSDLAIKYMNIAQAEATANASKVATIVKPATTTSQTGTVTTAGQPVNAQGVPATVESYSDILRINVISESKYNIKDVDQDDLNSTKDYMDAENISYIEDENGSTIDFDEDEFDEEIKEDLPNMNFKKEYTDDILSIENDDDDQEDTDDNEDIVDVDQKIDEEKVFYVQIDDEGESFVGKIYKLFDEGNWRSKLVDGESETFEKLNFDSQYDEIDIISFLRENYADAELIDENEFDDHVENPEVEPEETTESLHSIPTLDEFMLNESISK